MPESKSGAISHYATPQHFGERRRRSTPRPGSSTTFGLVEPSRSLKDEEHDRSARRDDGGAPEDHSTPGTQPRRRGGRRRWRRRPPPTSCRPSAAPQPRVRGQWASSWGRKSRGAGFSARAAATGAPRAPPWLAPPRAWPRARGACRAQSRARATRAHSIAFAPPRRSCARRRGRGRSALRRACATPSPSACTRASSAA